jgi:hypothetical protein
MTATNDRADRALDAALEMTFPASDPVAVRIHGTFTTADLGRSEAAPPDGSVSRQEPPDDA